MSTLTVLVAVCLYMVQVNALEIRTTTVNQTVVLSLPCNTSKGEGVDWKFLSSVPGTEEETICYRSVVIEPYFVRFSVDSTYGGRSILQVVNVSMDDAGIYTCVEESGLGKSHAVKLVVITAAASINDPSIASTASTTASDGCQHLVTAIESGEQGAGHVAGIAICVPLLIAVLILTIVVLYKTKKIELPCLPRRRVTRYPEHDWPLLAVNTHSRPERLEIDPSIIMSVEQIQKALKTDVALINCIRREPLSKVLLKSLLKFWYFLPESTPRGVAVQTLSVVCINWWVRMSSLKRDRHHIRTLFKLLSMPYRLHPKLLHTMQTSDTALGIASIEDTIYVITIQSNVIKVFSSQFPYRPMSDIVVKYMKQPTDIVAWKPGKSTKLFVTDFKECCIWRIEVDGKYDKWSKRMARNDTSKPKKIAKPCSLSVVSDGLAFVTATSNPFVKIYGPQGELKKKIPLKENTLWLYCGVTPQLSLVTMINLPECKVLRPNSKDETFFHRFHVSFDAEGRCFCCDRARNCVYLLTSDLREYRMLLSTIDLKEPNKVCYVASDGNLWICDQNSVKLFQVVKPSD